MEDIGYESHNFVVNMKSLAIFYCFYFLQVSVFLILKALSKCRKGKPIFPTVYNALYKVLFFGEIISILFEGYLEFLVSAYLNIINNSPLYTTILEDIGSFLSFSVLPILVIILPSLIIYGIF